MSLWLQWALWGLISACLFLLLVIGAALCAALFANRDPPGYSQKGTSPHGAEAQAAIEILYGKRPRVLLVGQSGSGKSTLGAELAHLFRLEFANVDGMQFKRTGGWQVHTREEVARRTQKVMESPNGWVFDGCFFRKTRHLFLNNVDLVVHLDYTYSFILWRLLWRTVGRVVRRERLWGTENSETIWQVLSLWDKEKSIFRWQASTFRQYRSRVEEFRRDCGSNYVFLTFRSPEDTEKWVKLCASRAKEKSHASNLEQ